MFVNTYIGDVRRQQLKSQAVAPLSIEHIPASWRRARVVHLGPPDDEVDPNLVYEFPGPLVGATLQDWMRAWDDQGIVRPKRGQHAEELLPRLDAAIFNEEDVGHDRELEAHYARLARLMVVTRASQDCTVYRGGAEPLHIPAPSVPVADATGAGDVFADMFLVMLERTRDEHRSAVIATQLASASVTRIGLDGVPTAEEIQAALAGNFSF